MEIAKLFHSGHASSYARDCTVCNEVLAWHKKKVKEAVQEVVKTANYL